MKLLQTTTLSNQDISTSLLIGTYTLTAIKDITISVLLDGIVGNGNYQIYVTRRLLGAGTSYPTRIITEAVPNTVTSHLFDPIKIVGENTDVIKVYVTGVGTDTTTPDIITRFYETNDPDSVWGYVSRTLTQTAAEVISTVEGSLITIYNDTSVSITLTGLGDMSAYTEVYFSVKYKADVVDANSVLQISENHGLLRLHGVTIPTASDGDLNVDNSAVGNITITLKPASSALLPATTTSLYYDVKMITATTANVLTSARLDILQSVTRAVA